MNTEEKNNLEETNNGEPIQNENQSKFKAKLIAFLKNNKAASVLTVLLLVVFMWFSIKIRMNEKNFNNEKTQLITQYESKIDSLQIKHLEFATEVFSWSVRSELLRNNTENLNQLLTVFVKESGADLVQIVNSEDKIIILSSDKKFEGVSYSGLLNFEIKKTMVLEDGGVVKIITPVMGFNNMIGILIVELRKE
jgi:Ca2+/Na+ antiporter